MYIKAAARSKTTAAPIAIPAIAPPESFDECDAAAVAVGEELAAVGIAVPPVAVVVRVGRASTGKYSMGLNSSVAFKAKASWVEKVNVELGLMTPIIP